MTGRDRVAHQPLPQSEPTESALDDPAARQNVEISFAIDAAHNFDDEVAEDCFLHKPGAFVGAVGEQSLEPRPAIVNGTKMFAC